jgi:hypothetical protein
MTARILSGAEHFNLHLLLQSPDFWSALAGAFAGAIAAFALGAFGQWRAAANSRRSAGNRAILTLAEMWSEAKGMHAAMFLSQDAEFERLLRRKPYLFEYRAVMDLRSEPPSLDVDSLGFLVDSTDPDILMRLSVARTDFGTMLKLAATHERLQLELQKRVASSDPRPNVPYRAEEIRRLAGPDLIAQLEAVTQTLRGRISELTDSLPRLLKELQTALSYALPSHSFVQFIPADRGPLSASIAPAVKAALWRRGVRTLARGWNRLFGPRWPVPVPSTKAAKAASAEKPRT